ncbi:MAG: GLUG motif-containing protein [Gracilimonas sp.]|nr:GLUG motif-containing protein [Gracilimonas sp.]
MHRGYVKGVNAAGFNTVVSPRIIGGLVGQHGDGNEGEGDISNSYSDVKVEVLNRYDRVITDGVGASIGYYRPMKVVQRNDIRLKIFIITLQTTHMNILIVAIIMN